MNATDSDPDLLYARGGITRDQWKRLRRQLGAGTVTPSTSPPPAPAQRSRTTTLLVAVVLIVVAAVVVAFLWSAGTRPGPALSPSYGPVQTLSASDLATLNATATQGLAFAGNDTLWFRGDAVTLVVSASPPDHDMNFVIQGLLNPTIHVVPGTRVAVVAVNMDPDMYHTWTLSAQGPPYGSMPMMGSAGMMGSSSMVGTGMLGPISTSGFSSQRVVFTATVGSYWYLCAVMGHAAQGMYGGFIVQ